MKDPWSKWKQMFFRESNSYYVETLSLKKLVNIIILLHTWYGLEKNHTCPNFSTFTIVLDSHFFY